MRIQDTADRRAFFKFSLCMWLFLWLATDALADFHFTPRISAGVTYTDNVFLAPDHEEHDIITFVSPGVGLEWTGRNYALGIDYAPIYNSYLRFPERNYLGHSGTLDGWTEIARGTRLELTNTAVYTQDPPDMETDTTVRQGGEPYFANTATIGVVNQFGAEDSIALHFTHYILENEDPTIEDSAYYRPEMLITHWFSPNRYALEMEAAYTVSNFEESQDFDDLDARIRFTRRFSSHLDGYIEYGHVYLDYYDDGEEDYQVYSPLVGFTWDERSDTHLGASFGYFYRDNEVSEDDDGIVGTIEMSYAYSRESTFSMLGDVGYDRAYFGAENLGFNPYYSVSGSIDHQINRLLTGSVTAGYRRNLYIDETPDREDAVWSAGAGLAYQPLTWLTANLDYLYRQINSNVNINDYTENRVTLSVTLAPGQPVRFGR